MLSREEAGAGLLGELEQFGQLVGSLSEEQLALRTRCDEWTVGDIAAHFIGDMADIMALRFDRVGTPEGAKDIVDERRGRTPAELAEEMQGVHKAAVDFVAGIDDATWNAPGPTDLVPTLGFGINLLWFDGYVHDEDIRAAVGAAPVRGPGLRVAVHYLAEELGNRGWGPATLALDGQDELNVGDGGQRIEGDALDFVLVATGRADPGLFGLDETVNIYRA